jgi:tetratricopeptide (TPR) repeat protein
MSGASAERTPVEPAPDDARGWGALGDELRLAGDGPGADRAYTRQIRASLSDPELIAAADALCEGEPAYAHRLLSALLSRRPDDTAALRMFADLAARSGRHNDAETLLARCLAKAPDIAAARCAYAMALHQQGKTLQTIAQTDLLLKEDPSHPVYRQLRAAALMRVGEFQQAADAYRTVLAACPDVALTWMAYGHALKTLGQQGDAVAAYREALRLRPGLGEAWWSLANLKTVALSQADIGQMETEAARPGVVDEDHFHLLFALGKAYEDAGAYEQAFRRYEEGNALRRASLPYDADETSIHVARCKALLSRSFFATQVGRGSPRPDPIFIVGLPRSGSTLIEQILASHSQVEGTQELPDIEFLASRLGGHAKRPSESVYPDVLAVLSVTELNALGEEYLQRARAHRKTAAPFFTDKMPNNFAHIGLIQLMLPNAKIIDARRHPVGCCFSAFKQHFAMGQPFTYGLDDLARYYRDYVELMAHFDAVLPGRVHRVIYEQLVADPEAEVRRLLAHCGLPFEANCLRFYENDRAVLTASSEQVRQPIFTDATEHWRHFEPWLGPLVRGLGAIVETYSSAPEPKL